MKFEHSMCLKGHLTYDKKAYKMVNVHNEASLEELLHKLQAKNLLPEEIKVGGLHGEPTQHHLKKPSIRAHHFRKNSFFKNKISSCTNREICDLLD